MFIYVEVRGEGVSSALIIGYPKLEWKGPIRVIESNTDFRARYQAIRGADLLFVEEYPPLLPKDWL